MLKGCNAENCRPWNSADPNQNTVKFDASKIQQAPSAAEELKKKQEDDRKAEEVRRENERKAEESRKEEARKAAERRAEEARKEAARKAEELRKEEERKAEQARKEAQRKADEDARKAQQEEEDLAEVGRFCKDNGFAGVNVKRKKGFGSKYALHSAVKKKDAVMIGRLLRRNADPALLNSSFQTPYQLADKMNSSGADMSAVLAALPTP